MSDEVRGRLIRQLIAEIDQDALDWPSLDLHRLLNLCDFASKPLDDPIDPAAIFRYHPYHRGLTVLIYRSDGVHPGKAQQVAGIAREYLRLSGL